MENYEEEYKVGTDSRKEWQKEMKEQFHKQNTREGRIKLQIEELSKVIEEGAWYGEMSSKVDELRQLEKALEQEKPQCAFISASPESIDKMYHYLKGDLAEMYRDINKDNINFKNDVFLANIDYFEKKTKSKKANFDYNISDSGLAQLQLLLDQRLLNKKLDTVTTQKNVASIKKETNQIESYLSVDIDEKAVANLYKKIKRLEQ